MAQTSILESVPNTRSVSEAFRAYEASEADYVLGQSVPCAGRAPREMGQRTRASDTSSRIARAWRCGGARSVSPRLPPARERGPTHMTDLAQPLR